MSLADIGGFKQKPWGSNHQESGCLIDFSYLQVIKKKHLDFTGLAIKNVGSTIRIGI